MRPRTRVRAAQLVRHRPLKKALTIIGLLSVGLALLLTVRHTLGDGAAGLFEGLSGDPLLAIPPTVLDRSPTGRLTWPARMATLESHEAWRRCAPAGEVGTVSVDVSMDAFGVATAAVRAASEADPAVPGPAPVGVSVAAEACVIAFAGALRFGAPVGGPAQARLRFHFEPGRAVAAP